MTNQSQRVIVPLFVSFLFLLGSVEPARGVACPAATTVPGNPVTWSASHRYAFYLGAPIPLLGQSNEYLCHVTQPDRAAQYCTLDNYVAILNTMQANKNNLLRLWSVLNNSPGVAFPDRMPPLTPYPDEQPFILMDGKWDLSEANPTFYSNLEKVVCEAYNRGIIVEVTLLDPWCNPWTSSPFNSANTVAPSSGTQLGFPNSTGRRLFASFENTTTKTDPTYLLTRNAQKDAVARTVLALRKYPNVIFEIANEPDFIPITGVTIANVMDWQNAMLAIVQANDSTPPHMIEINGHTTSSFAWTVPASQMSSSHYTQVVRDSSLNGAIETALSTTASIVSGRATRVLAFNENRWASILGVSTTNPLYRTADGVRSEAWEFMLNGGGAFDGYTLDRAGVESKKVVPQLGVLTTFLNPIYSGNIGLQSLDAMQQTSCNGSSDWCRGVPQWGNLDEGDCGGSGARIFWSSMKSGTDFALYVHHGVFQSDLSGGKFDAYQARLCGNGTTSGYRLPVAPIPQPFQYRVPQAGCWAERWIDPKTGLVKASTYRSNLATSIWNTPVTIPRFTHDMLFFVTHSCPTGL